MAAANASLGDLRTWTHHVKGGQCVTMCFTQRKEPSTYWTGNTVFYKDGLDILKDRIISCLPRDSEVGPSNPQRILYTYYVIPVHIWIKYTVNSYSELHSHEFQISETKSQSDRDKQSSEYGVLSPMPSLQFLATMNIYYWDSDIMGADRISEIMPRLPSTFHPVSHYKQAISVESFYEYQIAFNSAIL